MNVSYHNSVANVLTGAGVVADITVFDAGTSNKSTVYSDSGGTPLANPFGTDTYGRFVFYAEPGTYDIQVSGVIIDTYTLYDVSLVALAATPPGKYAVTGLYVDPSTGKFNVSYDNTI